METKILTSVKGHNLFVCFLALRPKSTAMVIAGRLVHLTTLFPGQAWTSSLPVLRAHTFACNWQQPFLNDSAEGRRMTIEIISWSISTKVWDRAGIELATPGSAVRLASVARHVTDCATRPGMGHNSFTNVQKMMCNNPNLDLVNINANTKCVKILSICSQDIERKWNYDGQRMMEGMTNNPNLVYSPPPFSKPGFKKC